nr:hypothetical protein [Tanacetum cinerariifolium]
MAGLEPITPLNEGTSNQNTTKSIIEGYVSALKELLKEPSNQDLIKPMLLDFDDIQGVSNEEIKVNKKGKAKVGNEDLSKPFKEVLKCPFTRRIVEFLSPGHRLLTTAKIYDGMSDPEDHVCRLACDKYPTEILKIIRRANETLPNFKERWVSESNAIPNVSELMQISSFMSSHKCLELSKRFLDNISMTVDEMFKRVDDYLLSEEAFRNTELPKGEFQRKEALAQWAQRNDRHQWLPYGNHRCRSEHRHTFRAQEHHAPYRPPQCPNQEFRRPRENKAVLTLDSLISTPSRDLSHRASTAPATTNTVGGDEKWMNVPITLPPVLARVLSEKALVVEAEVEGYLVRRIHIDKKASGEIMFEHCFNMLHPSTRARRVGKKQAAELPREIKPREKVDESWRMSIDFKNINAACLKDYYPLPDIDIKIESVIDQGTYCYTKMPFGLKNTRAMYQRLVDEAFQSQIGRNLEEYVDDMVVKSKSKREMLADTAETFNNLRRINMKLNLKSARLG